METMTAAQRREVASKAAKTHWAKHGKKHSYSPYFLKTACNEHFKLDLATKETLPCKQVYSDPSGSKLSLWKKRLKDSG